MAEIVSEANFLDDEEDVRIVRLASFYGYDITEVYANISPRKVCLRRLSSEKPPQTATFSASEMDALCEAWTQFKADRQAALDAEELRKQEVVNQVLARAQEYHIEVKKDELGSGQDGWHIHCEAYHKFWGNCTYAYNSDDLEQTIDHIVESITRE